jgi:hypothetical protein
MSDPADVMKTIRGAVAPGLSDDSGTMSARIATDSQAIPTTIERYERSTTEQP